MKPYNILFAMLDRIVKSVDYSVPKNLKIQFCVKPTVNWKRSLELYLSLMLFENDREVEDNCFRMYKLTL